MAGKVSCNNTVLYVALHQHRNSLLLLLLLLLLIILSFSEGRREMGNPPEQ